MVLDASSLIAFIGGEPGWERVEAQLQEGARISAVNLSEVAGRLARGGRSVAEVLEDVSQLGVVVERFDSLDARIAAELIPATRPFGLSLADRACLALAVRTSDDVLTADRAWADVEVGVGIELIR